MKGLNTKNPRSEVEESIAANNLSRLLKMTGMLHGHFCPFLALGVRAALRAVKELGTSSTGMENVIAIVETNNCFSDGIQFVTGCSFGNNALIYRDYGKTAFTLVKRDGEAVRVSLKADNKFLEEREPEAMELFQKVVARHQGTEDDQKRLKELWSQASFKMLDVPDNEIFDVNRVTINVPAYSRIFASVKCSVCGESIMETRARIKDGKPVCISCSGQEYYQLGGNGISLRSKQD